MKFLPWGNELTTLHKMSMLLSASHHHLAALSPAIDFELALIHSNSHQPSRTG